MLLPLVFHFSTLIYSATRQQVVAKKNNRIERERFHVHPHSAMTDPDPWHVCRVKDTIQIRFNQIVELKFLKLDTYNEISTTTNQQHNRVD